MSEDLAADLARRIEDLRAFEREYRGRLRAYFERQLGVLSGTGELLDAEQRRHTENARSLLSGWDEAGITPLTGPRQGALESNLRALLTVIDEIAPRKD